MFGSPVYGLRVPAALLTGLVLCLTTSVAPAAGGKPHREPRRSVSLPESNFTLGDSRSEHRRAEVFQGAVFALLADKHCRDFSLDLSRLSDLLKRHGYKPADLGPRSRFSSSLDRYMEEADELFSGNPRRACEIAWTLVGEGGEIADLARPLH
jgi:hypothetical protein